MGANAGLGILAVLGVASILTTVTFLQLEAWAPTWEAWLAAAPPQGAGYSGDRLAVLQAPAHLHGGRNDRGGPGDGIARRPAHRPLGQTTPARRRAIARIGLTGAGRQKNLRRNQNV